MISVSREELMCFKFIRFFGCFKDVFCSEIELLLDDSLWCKLLLVLVDGIVFKFTLFFAGGGKLFIFKLSFLCVCCCRVSEIIICCLVFVFVFIFKLLFFCAIEGVLCWVVTDSGTLFCWWLLLGFFSDLKYVFIVF